MYCTGIIIGLGDGFGFAWHGVLKWERSGYARIYFGSYDLYTV